MNGRGNEHRRSLGRWTVGLILGVVLWLSPGMVAALEKVQTRAWLHSEFGRIVFDWRSPVKHTAEVSGTTLTIRFGRKFSTSLDHVTANLDKYIRNISLGKDGRSVVAELIGEPRMRSFVNQGDIVVDLAERPQDGTWGASIAPPPPPKPLPKPLPKPVAKKVKPKPAPPPQPPPVLKVRTGEHKGFSRVVFDWKRAVDYRLDRHGAKVDIHFDRRATIDSRRLKARLSGKVSEILASDTKRGLRIGLQLPDGARVRHFRDGTRVVVDILSGDGKSSVGNSGPDGKSASGKKMASGRPVSLIRQNAVRAKKPVRRKGRRKKTKFGPMGALVTVDVARRAKDELTISFNWRQDAAAAIYQRQQNLWVFFDQSMRIDLGGLKISGKGIVKGVEQYPVSKGAFLRISLADRYASTVHRRGSTWVVDISSQPRPEVAKPIDVKVESDGLGGSRVLFALPGAMPPIRLHDPEIGDVVSIVPVKNGGHGNSHQRRFVDFVLFASPVGLAYHELTERLQVSTTESGVVVTGPRGLNVSRPVDIARFHELPKLDDKSPLMNIQAWARGPAEMFEENRSKLIGHIIEVPESQRNAARIQLAKFNIAHNRPSDALGIIEVVMRQRVDKKQLLTLHSLRAAANYLLRHYAEAEKEFDRPELALTDGVAPWLSGVSAAKGDWTAAYDGFAGALQVISHYPHWLRRHFLLIAAEAALVTGETDEATAQLKAVELLDPPPEQLAEMDYLRGYILKQSGEIEEAEKLWRAVMNGKHRRARAKAMFAHVELELERESIDRAKAIELLEQLSFAWRGDVFEFDLLRRLGEHYLASGQHRTGLTRLRQAASYFKKVDGAQGIAQQMNLHFKKLYLEGLADELPPVTALALFEEFRELTPAASDGDEMIRKLAGRLSKVDLLDEAAELLAHQVEFRLKGEEKSRVGTQVAAIRLQNGQPDKALVALDGSVAPDLPADLMQQRWVLKARALSQLDRPKEAMAVLKGDYRPDTEKLRVELYWHALNWRDAADTLQRILHEKKVGADDAEGTRMVLQWTVALAMLNDGAGIGKLRERFGEAMKKSVHAKAYQAIAGNSLEGLSNYKELIKAAGNLDALQAFVSK